MMQSHFIRSVVQGGLFWEFWRNV